MIAEPNCHKRKCLHFIGVRQPDGEEPNEFPYCPAFPDGIPPEIAYGDNLHQTPFPSQPNDIVFEEE